MHCLSRKNVIFNVMIAPCLNPSQILLKAAMSTLWTWNKEWFINKTYYLLVTNNVFHLIVLTINFFYLYDLIIVTVKYLRFFNKHLWNLVLLTWLLKSSIFSCNKSIETLSSSTTQEICNFLMPYASGTSFAEIKT